MKKSAIFLIGIFFGAASWAVCPLVGDRFEPFDSDIGLLLGQGFMSMFAIHIGWTKKFKSFLIAVLGLYLGQISYAYIFGSDELRAWFFLGTITTLALCVLPFFAGVFSKIIRKLHQRYCVRS